MFTSSQDGRVIKHVRGEGGFALRCHLSPHGGRHGHPTFHLAITFNIHVVQATKSTQCFTHPWHREDEYYIHQDSIFNCVTSSYHYAGTRKGENCYLEFYFHTYLYFSTSLKGKGTIPTNLSFPEFKISAKDSIDSHIKEATIISWNLGACLHLLLDSSWPNMNASVLGS